MEFVMAPTMYASCEKENICSDTFFCLKSLYWKMTLSMKQNNGKLHYLINIPGSFSLTGNRKLSPNCHKFGPELNLYVIQRSMLFTSFYY